MKKILAFLLSAAMLLSLTACAAAETAAKSDLKVGLCVAGTLGDLGFYDSAYEGLTKLEADYGVEGSVIECKSDGSMYRMALTEAADSCDVIVAIGWEFWEPLEEVVPEATDKKFIFIDNGLDGVGDNLMSIIYADNQGSFLAGYIAMKCSKAQVVGVVGGEDYDTTNNFIVGYKQGALYANPDGKVLDPVYTNNWDAVDLGKEAALSLYGQGADVVFHVAGKAGLGVFQAAEETGNFAIGVDSDQKHVSPDVILCSMVKDVGLSVYDAIGKYITEDAFQAGKIWEADIGTGFISIGYGEPEMTQLVSDELKAEVEALREKIISGEIVVDSVR